MQSVASLFQKDRVQKQLGSHSNLTNQELLEHLKLSQEGVLTYGAILCFGKNPSRWVAGAFTRCTSWIGNDRLEGWEEDLEFREGLLEQYESSIGFLQRSLRLSRVISAQGSVERWEIPLMVLQEALANALIHREYANQTNSGYRRAFSRPSRSRNRKSASSVRTKLSPTNSWPRISKQRGTRSRESEGVLPTHYRSRVV